MTIDTTKLKKPATRGRKPNNTKERVKMIKKLLDAGYTQESIAKAMGLSRSTICRALRD
ncbi:TPA: helix-turn-helix domain-containing protein [Vibrio parahaemolyticus]|nr:helix-turn-helix domain-containing protein [Vibrio parahaemolyticus]